MNPHQLKHDTAYLKFLSRRLKQIAKTQDEENAASFRSFAKEVLNIASRLSQIEQEYLKKAAKQFEHLPADVFEDLIGYHNNEVI